MTREPDQPRNNRRQQKSTANAIGLTSATMRKFIYISIVLSGVLCNPMTFANDNKDAVKDLREMVFNLDPGDIGFNRDNFEHPVWGMVMETGLDNGFYTLVTLADGTTSLYWSSGGGTIGAGEHEAVRIAVSHLLSGAQYFYKNAHRVEKFPEPSDGEVIFYFLTFDGHAAYSAPEEKLGNGNDELSALFYAAHDVISEIREITEN